MVWEILDMPSRFQHLSLDDSNSLKVGVRRGLDACNDLVGSSTDGDIKPLSCRVNTVGPLIDSQRRG